MANRSAETTVESLVMMRAAWLAAQKGLTSAERKVVNWGQMKVVAKAANLVVWMVLHLADLLV